MSTLKGFVLFVIYFYMITKKKKINDRHYCISRRFTDDNNKIKTELNDIKKNNEFHIFL